VYIIYTFTGTYCFFSYFSNIFELQLFSVFLKTNTFSSLLVRTINDDSTKRFKPLLYALSNQVQRENVKTIIDEFDENLKNVSGKCMDIGCGPGDITKEIILPALDPNATIIGKKTIICINIYNNILK